MKHAYIVANDLTIFNQQLVKDAGITTTWSKDSVSMIIENCPFIFQGHSAKVRGNVLSIKRSGVVHKERLHDLIDVDLTRAVITLLQLESVPLDIKPEYRLPVGFLPIRPLRGVYFSVDPEGEV